MPELTEQEVMSLVTVDGVKYNLSVAPTYTDPLVKREVKKILCELSLNDVTENLYLSVQLYHVAFCGVSGAKLGTKAIQAEIQVLQSELAKVCNSCITTMQSFESGTADIVNKIITSYRWLVKGKEKLAITQLRHCGDYSAEMSQSARALAEELKKLQTGTVSVRSDTINIEANANERRETARIAAAEISAKQKAEQANSVELFDQITDTQKLYEEAKTKEESESKKALVLGIVSAITGAIGAGLGAFAATQNPVTTIANSVKSTSANNQASTNQKVAAEQMAQKKQESDDAQQKLIEANDLAAAKQAVVTRLTSEADLLNKTVETKETATGTTPEELTAVKTKRDAKQSDLNQAKIEMAELNRKVKPLEKTAKDNTAAYAAAGVTLQDLAKNTNNMASTAATAEESAHQEKMKFLDLKMKLEAEKRKSLIALAEYAQTIKNLEVIEGDATLSISSLHTAIEALGKIIGSLVNASLFWDQMAEYCRRMSDKGFQETIKDLIDPENGLTEEDRLECYHEENFMKEILLYMCQWVAVNGLSTEYITAAADAQKKCVENLGITPSIDEARGVAIDLAKNLDDLVSRDLLQSRQISAELEQQKALIETRTVAV